jgi:hypothetical protein
MVSSKIADPKISNKKEKTRLRQLLRLRSITRKKKTKEKTTIRRNTKK